MTDEVCLEALALREKHGSTSKAALASGIPRPTLQHRVLTAVSRGLDRPPVNPVPEGFEINRISKTIGADGKVRESIRMGPPQGPQFEMPDGFSMKKGTFQLGPDGNVERSWPRVGPEERSVEDIAEILKEAFTECKGGAEPTPPPDHTVLEDLMAFMPVADLHMGLYAWREETGNNWDLPKAIKVITAAFDQVVAGTKACGTAVILGGGDQMHSDNNQNQTARSGNALDVDGRYAKVLKATCHLFVHMTDAALNKHGKVVIRVLPGNHDEHACYAISYFLLAWFRNEPRVTVDIDPSLFWWLRFGSVLLGATHGHQAKIKDMPQIMAHRRAKEWGQTKHRYVHGFHLHHKEMTKTENGGVVTEIHQTPAPQDGWHYGMGFMSGRSMCSITYHEAKGELGRVTEPIQDDG